MAYTRLSMRKIKEILRLHYSCKLSNRQIGISCKVSKTTVNDYLARTKAIGVTWPIPENLTDQDLEELLYPKSKKAVSKHEMPNWELLSKELQKKGVTRKLLWEEYLEETPDGLGYSRFCELHRQWIKSNKAVSMRIDHKAGEKLFIDYAGPKVPIHTSEGVKNADIFIATLGASNYTYVEATWSQNLYDWLSSHVRAFNFLGGTPEILVPDNLKSGVKKACYYEPDINESYKELAEHHGVAVIPARKRKPKDKAKVENAVLIAERWILAKIRNEKFFSLDALNSRISELLVDFNTKPFQKLEGCRQSIFEELDQPALKPLPMAPYEYSEKKLARVNIDYHIEYKTHYYSVPYKYAKKEVKLRITRNIIEVFYKDQRIASHQLSNKKGRHTTIKDHMPTNHRKHSEWSPERLMSWASTIGPSVCEVVKRIMESRSHPEQGYRSCLGVIRLEKNFGSFRLEQACLRALNFNTISYKSIQSILKSGLDATTIKAKPESKSISHDNIRGSKILIH